MKKFLQWQLPIKARGNKTGYSLIELLIVIALVAFFMTLAVTTSTLLNRFLVKAELDRLCAACRYVQQVALLKNKEQIINLDPKTNSYTFFTSTHKLPRGVQFGVIDHAMGPPSAPEKPLGSSITFLQNNIIFYPDGIVSSGTVYLTDAAKKYLFALTSPIAGISYLRKYEYTKGWHTI